MEFWEFIDANSSYGSKVFVAPSAIQCIEFWQDGTATITTANYVFRVKCEHADFATVDGVNVVKVRDLVSECPDYHLRKGAN